jgi:protein-L-isoaspartate(D-aspartate) O-methyltransferase
MPEMKRERLIQELIEDGYLKTRPIIEAFWKIDRANFIPEDQKSEAYENHPLQIGFGQTISQPLTVVFMLELLGPKAGEKILDVGTGSGWQAALLGELVGSQGKVISIERIPELKNFAEENLRKAGMFEKGVIEVKLGNGILGDSVNAPFDGIIAAAAGDKIPSAWKEQLKIGGRIVAPVKESIMVLDKKGLDEFEEKRHFGFSFVPLVPEDKAR